MNHNTKLSSILQGNLESIKSAWQNTEPAGDFEPMPASQAFADAPDHWVCPECGADKSMFSP